MFVCVCVRVCVCVCTSHNKCQIAIFRVVSYDKLYNMSLCKNNKSGDILVCYLLCQAHNS